MFRVRMFRVRMISFVCALAGILTVTPAAIRAADFAVDTESDEPDVAPGDGWCATAAGRCTLRAALEEANATAGHDSVVLPKGNYDIRGAALVVADDLTLSGAGAKPTLIRSRNRESVIRIAGSPVVVIHDLRLEGGRSQRGAGIDNPAGTLTLTDVTFKFNRANSGLGGALYNNGTARLERVTMTGNVGRAGGAVYNDVAGDLQVVDTTMRRNRHRVPGGGGCLYNAGSAVVERSLLARCQGRIGDGGGGILNRGTLALRNSTLWGCRARLGQGGAIVNDAGATIDIESSTIIRNQAAFVAAGVVNYGGATIRNSILWGNFSRERDSNCGGVVPLLSLGYNIDGGLACGFAEVGDAGNTDPKVGRDKDNGGPTRTRDLKAGSPAVDAGDDVWCPPTDQRGVPRPVDGDGDGRVDCDIGAYECTTSAALAAAAALSIPAPGIEAPEFQANTESFANQHAPVVTTFADGEMLVAWQAGPGQDGDGDGIFAQRFDALGNRIGAEFQLNQGGGGDQTNPVIASVGDEVVAAWESLAGGATEQAIIARRFDRFSATGASEVRIDGPGGIASQPAIGLGADGTASVVWLDGPAGAESLHLRRVLPGDAELGAIVTVDPGDTVDPTLPSVAVGATGDRMVVWSGEREERPGVFARLYDSGDQSAGNVIAVWHPEEDVPDLPTASVASDAAGRFVVVWQMPGEDLDGERDVIAAQRFTADGVRLGGLTTVSRVALGYRARPRVAASPGGHFLVVWESETDDDLSGASVVARRFDDAGKALGDEFRVSTRTTVFQMEPSVGAHANGAFQVVWASDAQDGDGYGVFGHTTAIEGLVGYRAKETDSDGNRVPRQFNVRIDDLVLEDGSADDGENYSISRVRNLLHPSLVTSGADDGVRASYVRYAVQPSRQGAGAGDKDRFPRAERHRERRWEVDNRFGTLVVESKRATSLLLPVALPEQGDGDPDAAAYVCYQIKASPGESSTQLVGNSFRRDLQVFAADRFDDCATDKGGDTSFAGTVVQGKCLYQIRKPVELCNPVAIDNVEAPRETTADIEPTTSGPVASLLCYQAKTATRVYSADASVQIGRRGQLQPPQSRHARRLKRFGNAVTLAPLAGLPAPFELDTSKSELICVPTRIRDVALLQ